MWDQSVIAGCWLVLGITICPRGLAAEAVVADLLQYAEQISSIDRNKLDTVVAQLQPRLTELSRFQQQQFRLLQVDQALHNGQTALATEVLQDFSSTAQPLALRYRAQLLSARTAMLAQQYQAAFNHLHASLQDYRLVRQPHLQAATLLLAIEFYLLAGMKDEAQQQVLQLASFADAKVEQCQATYLQVRQFDRQQLSQATLISQDMLNNCATNQLLQQARALELFNHRTRLAGQHANTASDSPAYLPVGNALPASDIDSQLWHTAFALSAKRFTDAEQFSAGLLALPEATMTMVQRLDLLRLRQAVFIQQQQLAGVLSLQKKISELEQSWQNQQTMLKLAAQNAANSVRQKNDQLRLLQEELKAADLEAQLKQQQVQRNQAVIGLLLLLAFGLGYGLYRLGRAHQHYKTVALTDRSTGIGNRRWLDLHLSKLLQRCQQQSRPAGMIVFEIDQFGRLLAEQGHTAAEQALITVSQICQHFIRHGDLFCYLDSGCFAIVLPDCQPDKVLMLAEICRDAIAEPEHAVQHQALQLTASFGVAFTLNSGYAAPELWRHADQALYLAKHHGQNRVEYFDNQPGCGRPLIHRALTTDWAG